jgi:CheY-like chemotaxis protein
VVLVAEDNKADIFLIREALAGIDAEVHIVTDGGEALQFLARAEADPNTPCPDLVLLDINLPKHKGGDILRALRAGSRCGKAAVLIVTSSDSVRDRTEMDRLGANAYFRKPSQYAEFMKLGGIVRLLLDRNGAGRRS